MNRFALALTAVLACGSGRAATADWVHAVVVPMVGPFSPTSGPPGRTVSQILEAFHPEIAEWSFLPTQDHPLHPKAIVGGLEYQEFPQSPTSDLAAWQKFFGQPFAPTAENGVAVNASGTLQELKYGSETPTLYYVCHNNPRWHAFHKESILKGARDASKALIRQDNIAVPAGVGWDNGGWCPSCLAGFKAWLGQHCNSRALADMGILELDRFDPRPALQAKLKLGDAMADDPLVRQYVRFLITSNLNAWRDEVEGAHAIRADVPVCGNQGSGSLNAYETVLLSDVSDLGFLENGRRPFPDQTNALGYKLTLAGGRHAKPAWIWDFATEDAMAQVDGSRLFMAECYTNGVVPYYELNNLGWSPRKGYYAIPLSNAAFDALSIYARFAHEHQALLTRAYRAETPIALAFPTATFVHRKCGALHLGGEGERRQIDHFAGWARALEALHLPYNVEVLGDDTLWPDRDLPARLARYRVVILPNAEALAPAQSEALVGYAKAGGRLLVSGDLGTRDPGFGKLMPPAYIATVVGDSGVGELPVEASRSRRVQTFCGLSQTVTLNQTTAKPLVVRGWSKARGVKGSRGSDYSLYVDLECTDGTPIWAQTALFKPGTHDWEQAEQTIVPAKPVRKATVWALFRYREGTAWFDDLFFGEPNGPNLLKDPGLEGAQDGKLPGWDAGPGGYAIDAAEHHEGAASARCVIAPPAEAPPAERKLQAMVRAATAGLPLPATDAPATVALNVVRQGDRLVVHLLNYDYEGGVDQVTPRRNVTVTIPLPAGTASAGPATLASPDAEPFDTPLAVTAKDGAVTFTVPEVKVWSMVVVPVKGVG